MFIFSHSHFSSSSIQTIAGTEIAWVSIFSRIFFIQNYCGLLKTKKNNKKIKKKDLKILRLLNIFCVELSRSWSLFSTECFYCRFVEKMPQTEISKWFLVFFSLILSILVIFSFKRSQAIFVFKFFSCKHFFEDLILSLSLFTQ